MSSAPSRRQAQDFPHEQEREPVGNVLFGGVNRKGAIDPMTRAGAITVIHRLEGSDG